MPEPISTVPDTLRPHRRYNPLTGEWVLVSPQRAARPWLGAQETVAPAHLPQYDPTCYLCPNNTRTSGIQNPPYTHTFVFPNDFPALLPPPPEGSAGTEDAAPHPLLRKQSESGECRVVCFSPRHDLTLAQMDGDEITGVIQTWTEQCRELGARADIGYVQVFENKGAAMGCSNPHPHSQIWATRHVPTLPAKEGDAQAAYLAQNGKSLLMDYAQLDQKSDRLVWENDTWLVVVPFWAVWPFETMILPKAAHLPRLTDATPEQTRGLGEAIGDLTRRYDRVFNTSFPYSMGIHQAPFDDADHPEWQTHLHFYPPLLRSATVRKFLVGYEMLAQSQRDLTPEQAADRLRKVTGT